ncbi:MAG TPA: fused MFS/spermidine synthase, partial [Bryobacteraceae bacterium]|nr:fused MFS/spermidine synthase [Bryobacteraceae bacterium]
MIPLTIFLSAFLLFQVQPMIGRYVLPWFGGGPAVWTNCMLFFQTMLLAGYGYAHWLGSRRSRVQSWVHMAVLAASLAFLPIAPRAAIWKTTAAGDPSGRILLLLAVTIGGPYLLLASTTPLVQRWFHLARPQEAPWRLYALSNLGSFLALFSYPLVLEPYFKLSTQTWIWSGLYVIFVALCGWVAWQMRGVKAAEAEAEAADVGPSALDIVMWLALSACGSVLLLGTTSQITQEIAVFPFLWIAPLSIYLLTFILTFESDRWYRRGVFAVLAGVLAPVTCAVITLSVAISVWKQFAVYAAALFVTCMVCHGELARSRPSPRHLTAFYLTIAAGGALGGVFAALIAPRVFSEFSEYPIGLAGACILGFLCWMRSGALAQWTGRNFAVRVPLMALMFGGIISVYAAAINKQPGLYASRNFYGILRVVERRDKNGLLRELSHGRVQHGFQYLDPDKHSWPTSYYGPHSGVALGIDALPHPRRVAVVGLGAGTLAAWGREGDSYRFYEINPNVEPIARGWFTFLGDSKAHTDVVLGDARIQLERELAEGHAHDFDLIAVDAFSGDAIPMHLLTAECAEIYRQRLAPGGIIALHISNRSLDLEPVTRGLARYLGWQARMVVVARDLLDEDKGESSSRWVLLTEKRETFTHSKIRDTILGWSTSKDPVITWTDDF